MKNQFCRVHSLSSQLTLVFTVAWLVVPRSHYASVNCCAINPDELCAPTQIYDCPDKFEQPPCETCPCPPGGPQNGGHGNSGPNQGAPTPGEKRGQADSGDCNGCIVPKGMPYYWVSEPNTNVRIEDRPWGYEAGRGLPVTMQISYRQRGAFDQDDKIFSLGPNWSCSLRSFVCVTTNNQGVVGIRQHKGGAGLVAYQMDAPEYRTCVMPTLPSTSSCVLTKPDGGSETYGFAYTNSGGSVLLFVTQRRDAAGNAQTYNYTYVGSAIRLTSITDADGKSSTLYYNSDPYYSNRIDHITDPYGRTAYLQYSEYGILTNVTDVQGLSSGFAYDTYGISSMTTPYGTTSFEYGGNALQYEIYLFTSYEGANRYVRVSLPNGGQELYVYRHDGSAVVTNSYSSVPVTSPLANSFDNVDQSQANSFYLGPLQYPQLSTSTVDSLTSADYALARQRHWLLNPNGDKAGEALSNERAPSPDGSTRGQVTWYDYAGKSGANRVGSSAFPVFVARVLPNGETAFDYTQRNQYGHVTNEVQTYTKPDSSGGLRTNKFIFAANGLDLVQHIGVNNEQVVSNYFNNAYHQVDASYDALNQETLFTYNGNRQLTSVQRPSGLTTLNVYFPSGTYAGWLEKTIDLEILRTNSFTYADGLVYSHTDERKLTTTNYWDNLQRLRGIRFPDGTTASNFFSDVHSPLDLTATKDRLGSWSYAGYNGVRQKIAETNANGVITRYGYCDCGALMSVTNAWNTAVQQFTWFNYDLQGNRTNTYSSDGYSVTNWFDALGRVIATGDGAAYTWFYYNNQGLVTNTTTAYGAAQIAVYDKEDHPIWVTDANGVTITNTYDELGRLRTCTYPDTGVEAFGYSARGLIAYTNQLGLTNFHAYDEAGRKTFETNANWELIRYTNNPAGDLIALVDGKNQVTKWNYDEYGRVTNKLDQSGTEILRYKYDAAGRLASRWSVAKGTTYYTNDTVGNLTYVNYPNSTDVAFAYDALNRPTTMVDVVGTTLYGYTLGGQLWTEDGPWTDDIVTNSYINRLRVGLDLKQPTGVWTNQFTYDAARRLTNVTSPAGAFGYLLSAYQPSTLIHQLALPNTSYITNTYDVNARLLSTTLKNSTNGTLNAHTYSYNPGHQRTQQSFSPSGSTYNYTYDKIGQLKVADSATSSEDRGYTYDAAWNLNYRTNNTTLKTFSVDGENQLTSTAEGGCSYDNNGNLTLSHGEKRSHIYDDENQLVQLYVSATPRPEYATEFVYDGLGRLRIRREYIYSGDDDSLTTPPPGGDARLRNQGEPKLELLGSSWTLASETRYIYDGWRVIQERDGSNVPLVSYTRGTDLSGSLEGAGGIGGLLGRSHSYSSGNWSTHNFYHADGNGNITYLVNSSQTLEASYRYDPYGNTISSSGSLASDNTYRFSSKMVHTISGLYYYGYRWYEPNFQRWVNRDPMGDRRQQLYHFVGNDPLVFIDPWGNWRANGKPHKGKDLSIVCDGKGGVRIYYPPGYDPKKQLPCIGTCVDAHENCHKNSALNANPDLCKGQKDGTQIVTASWEEKYEDEIRCSQEQLDCLDDCKDPCPLIPFNNEKDRIKKYKEDNKKKLKEIAVVY